MKKGEKYFTSAQNYIIRLLHYRERSKKEIRERLKEKKYPPEVIEKVIQWAEENNLINDLRFAKLWAKSKQEYKKLGNRRIIDELKQKGIDAETINLVLTENQEEEYRRAEYWAKRKIKLPPLKISSLLQRRGFSSKIIDRVLKDLKTKEDEKGEEVE